MDPLIAVFVSALGTCAAVLIYSLLKAEKSNP